MADDTRLALDLWAALERAGCRLRTDRAQLVVRPPHTSAAALTPEQRQAVAAVRNTLYALVAAAPTPDQQRHLDAQPPPIFAGAGNVALVERHGGPLTHDDAPEPVPDVTEEAQRDLFRSPHHEPAP